MVVSPTGNIIGEPLQDEEGIVYADIDVSQCVSPKQIHDVVGYYNRFDIFKLTVNRTANRPVSFEESGAPREQAAPARGASAERRERQVAEVELVSGSGS